MFWLEGWNIDEYKASVEEIEDPVDRLDELIAALKHATTYQEYFEFEQGTLIKKRFKKFKTWVEKEIKFLKSKNTLQIAERKKKAWKGHERLPYPVVWDKESYSKIEPEVRETGKKKEWIDWLIKHLDDKAGKYWTYEKWIVNSVSSEEFYISFAQEPYEVMCPSNIVAVIDNEFVIFLLNLQKILSLKEENKKIKAVVGGPVSLEKNELDKIIIKTIRQRHSSGKNLNWLNVMRDLKNFTRENQSISLQEFQSRDETMKKGISLYLKGFSEPIGRIEESTFKKKLSQFRKLLLPK